MKNFEVLRTRNDKGRMITMSTKAFNELVDEYNGGLADPHERMFRINRAHGGVFKRVTISEMVPLREGKPPVEYNLHIHNSDIGALKNFILLPIVIPIVFLLGGPFKVYNTVSNMLATDWNSTSDVTNFTRFAYKSQWIFLSSLFHFDCCD